MPVLNSAWGPGRMRGHWETAQSESFNSCTARVTTPLQPHSQRTPERPRIPVHTAEKRSRQIVSSYIYICMGGAAAVLQVLLEAPQYHRGYFEGLLATHGLHLTGVYMGPAMDPLLADLQARRKPAVFYGYHPSEVQSRPGPFSR